LNSLLKMEWEVSDFERGMTSLFVNENKKLPGLYEYPEKLFHETLLYPPKNIPVDDFMI
jgi:hypothetical protein